MDKPPKPTAAVRECILDAARNFAYEVDGLVEGQVYLSHTEDCDEFLLLVGPPEIVPDPPKGRIDAPGTISISAPTSAFLNDMTGSRSDN